MEPKSYSSEEILEMLKKANSKSLLKFLTDRVKEDDSLCQALGQYLDQPSTKTFNAKDFEDKVLKAWIRAFEDVEGKWRYSTIWDWDFIEKLQKILKRVRKESPSAEMRISLQVKFLENFKIRKNYKWNVFEEILEDIIQDFRSILETSHEVEVHLLIKKYLFSSCLNHLKKYKALSDESENRWKLESFILGTFKEDFPEQIKDYLNDRILSVLSCAQDHWDKEDCLTDYVKKMLELLSRSNASENELLSFAQKYWDFRGVRDWLIKYYKKKAQWDKAIKVIEDSLQREGTLPSKSYYYRKELKELYLLNGDKEKYRQILLEEIKEFKGEIQTDLEMFRELKSLYTPEEWTEEREQIFASKAADNELLAQYFLEDNLLDRLSKLLLAEETGYAFFDKYAYALPPQYSEPVLAKYQKHFVTLLLKAKDRIRYQELMDTLKDAHKIPGGKEMTLRLTTEWLKKYGTRPSLCEQIRKFQSQCKSMD